MPEPDVTETGLNKKAHAWRTLFPRAAPPQIKWLMRGLRSVSREDIYMGSL